MKSISWGSTNVEPLIYRLSSSYWIFSVEKVVTLELRSRHPQTDRFHCEIDDLGVTHVTTLKLIYFCFNGYGRFCQHWRWHISCDDDKVDRQGQADSFGLWLRLRRTCIVDARFLWFGVLLLLLTCLMSRQWHQTSMHHIKHYWAWLRIGKYQYARLDVSGCLWMSHVFVTVHSIDMESFSSCKRNFCPDTTTDIEQWDTDVNKRRNSEINARCQCRSFRTSIDIQNWGLDGQCWIEKKGPSNLYRSK